MAPKGIAGPDSVVAFERDPENSQQDCLGPGQVAPDRLTFVKHKRKCAKLGECSNAIFDNNFSAALRLLVRGHSGWHTA